MGARRSDIIPLTLRGLRRQLSSSANHIGSDLKPNTKFSETKGRSLHDKDDRRSAITAESEKESKDESKDASSVTLALILKRDPIILKEPAQIEMEFAALMDREEQLTTRQMSRNFHVPPPTTLDESEKPRVERNARLTEADQKSDLRSIQRKLDEALYFVVRKPRARKYSFPERSLEASDNNSLNKCAQKILQEHGCEKLDTWIIGNAPVGLTRGATNKTKKFYMKAIAMQGVAAPATKEWDFAWLCASELAQHMEKEKFAGIHDLLSID